MKWEELKNIIIKDISSRALKDPDRRLKSLEKIEIIIYLQNTSNIITTGKESFKKQISEIKGTGLNSAEISIINEIYNKLNPSLQQTKSPLKVRYKVYTCPNCYTMLQITEDLWDQDFLSCPQCGNDFSNPIKEEERLAKIQKRFIVRYGEGCQSGRAIAPYYASDCLGDHGANETGEVRYGRQ